MTISDLTQTNWDDFAVGALVGFLVVAIAGWLR